MSDPTPIAEDSNLIYKVIADLRRTRRIDAETVAKDASWRELADAVHEALDTPEQAVVGRAALSPDEVSTLSHDLRSSLNSLMLLARMLIEAGPEELSSQHMRAARMIYESGEEMLSTIDVLRRRTGLDD